MAYPPLEAAKLAGLSVSGVKIYAKRYAPFFSPSANPERNVPRSYTAQDVARLRLIGSLAKQGIPTAEIAQRLQDGETGDTPDDAAQNVIDGPQATQAAQAALVLVQTQIDGLRARELALTERLIASEIRAARLEAELTAAKMPFWKRLFGG
jgi:DNA-binding transcriptional MerR regulator